MSKTVVAPHIYRGLHPAKPHAAPLVTVQMDLTTITIHQDIHPRCLSCLQLTTSCVCLSSSTRTSKLTAIDQPFQRISLEQSCAFFVIHWIVLLSKDDDIFNNGRGIRNPKVIRGLEFENQGHHLQQSQHWHVS